MFLRSYRLHGDSYIEFQKCGRKHLKFFRIKHERPTSLYIKAEDFERFFEQYGGILRCARLPHGKSGFDAYGTNYYDPETADMLRSIIQSSCLDDHKLVADWLKSLKCRDQGFYVLGGRLCAK